MGVTVRVMGALLIAAFCAQHHIQAAAGCTLISWQQLRNTCMLCQHQLWCGMCASSIDIY